MHPTLDLGSPIPTYPVAVVFGVLLCWVLLLRRTARLGYPSNTVLVWVAVAFPVGAIGARSLALIVELPLGWLRGADVPYGQAGMTVLGSVIACLLFSAWFLPRNFPDRPWRLLDAVAFTFPLSLAFGRLGCLALGCCYGSVAPSWAPTWLTLELGSYVLGTEPAVAHGALAGSTALWNLPLLFVLQCAVSIVLVELAYRRGQAMRWPDGAVLLFAVAVDGWGRVPLEFARGGPWHSHESANPWQGIALALSVIVTVGLLLLLRRPRVAPGPSTG